MKYERYVFVIKYDITIILKPHPATNKAVIKYVILEFFYVFLNGSHYIIILYFWLIDIHSDGIVRLAI